MTTPDNSPGAQPGTETVNAAPVSEQPQAEQEPQSFDAYSADDLLGAIAGEAPTSEAPTSTPPPDATPQPPADPAPADGEEPSGDTPPPADPVTEAGTSKPPGRVSVRALPAEQQLETAQAIDMVRKGEASDILEALQAIRGTGQAPPADPFEDGTPPADQQTAPPAQPPAPPTSQDVTAIEAEIKELRAKRVAAKSEYDVDQEAALTEQIEDTIIRLNDAKMAASLQNQQQAAANASYEQVYQSTVVELESRFPDVLNDDSAFTRILDDKVTAAQARQDPALSDPRYLLKFAEEVASMLGASPTQPAAQPARSVPAPPAAPRRGTAADLAPASQTPRHSVDQVQAAFDHADPETLLAALVATGG